MYPFLYLKDINPIFHDTKLSRRLKINGFESDTCSYIHSIYTGELGYDVLNGTRKIGSSYAKSVIYI